MHTWFWKVASCHYHAHLSQLHRHSSNLLQNPSGRARSSWSPVQNSHFLWYWHCVLPESLRPTDGGLGPLYLSMLVNFCQLPMGNRLTALTRHLSLKDHYLISASGQQLVPKTHNCTHVCTHTHTGSLGSAWFWGSVILNLALSKPQIPQVGSGGNIERQNVGTHSKHGDSEDKAVALELEHQPAEQSPTLC